MHEYEFRLVVADSSSFSSLLQKLGYSTRKQVVYYVKPHFRYKSEKWEIKRVESVKSVYHDGLWFKWVHSIETPYRNWNQTACKLFLHNVGNFQNPLSVETRDFVQIDSHAQLYAFRSGESDYRLVFEWEYGTFRKPPTDFEGEHLLGFLDEYKRIYDAMREYTWPTYELNENITRKPVTCVAEAMEGTQYLYAHKLDGVFGLVYSYRDRVKEKWEGYECAVHPNATLGDGFVFAAEKLEGGEVVLLDVYQVRGHDTAGWCRRGILSEFLPRLKLMEGYFVQRYVSDKSSLGTCPFETDGVVIHDVVKDIVFKCKPTHSIDLVYFRGYFHLPNGRIKCLEKGLENGSVYEISTADGRVIRKRFDRFKGNSAAQIENVLAQGWHGPRIEKL